MRIVHIVPGSGGTFYCENCLRDTALVRAMRARGHDVIMVPLYLPIFTDETAAGDSEVFFGGVNVYLQQKVKLFRSTPRWLDRLFDSDAVLRTAARRAGSTRADGMGEMTHSMILGEDGRQAKELDRLVTWLASEAPPDVVHLSNVMLIGLARAIRERLGCPVVCSLQDEDVWIDAVEDPWKERCWVAISERCRDVAGLVAVSDWYAEQMRERLEVPAELIRTVHLGIDVSDMVPCAHAPEVPTIGFLARLCEAQGLGVLIDAYLKLRQRPGFEKVRLRATGGLTQDNRRFMAAQTRRLQAAGAWDDVDILEDFSRPARREFLAGLSVLSVPVPGGEAFGSFMLEAMAMGVPVVQPEAGAFGEIVSLTGGGVTYDPDAGDGLVSALGELLGNDARRLALGQAGRKTVREAFTIETMAEKMEAVYAGISRQGAGR